MVDGSGAASTDVLHRITIAVELPLLSVQKVLPLMVSQVLWKHPPAHEYTLQVGGLAGLQPCRHVMTQGKQ
jgi:hypothetical protein